MTTARPYPANMGEFQTYAEEAGTYPLIVALANGFTYNDDHEDAADITGELSGSGYARVTLSGVAWNRTDDVASLVANDPTFASFTGTFDTIVVFSDRGADSASPLIAHVAVGTTTATAETYTIDFPAGAIVTIGGMPEVSTVAGVEPDETGDIPVDELADALGVIAAGGALEPAAPIDPDEESFPGTAVYMLPDGSTNLLYPLAPPVGTGVELGLGVPDDLPVTGWVVHVPENDWTGTAIVSFPSQEVVVPTAVGDVSSGNFSDGAMLALWCDGTGWFVSVLSLPPSGGGGGGVEAQQDAEGLWIGTAAQYAAVASKSANVLYIVREV